MKRKLTGIILALLLVGCVFGIGAVSASLNVSVTNVSITSDVSGHDTKFIDGSTITAKFDTSGDVYAVADLEIADGLVISFTSTAISGSSSYHHEGSVTVPNDFGTEYKNYSDLKVQVTDSSGGSGYVDFGHLNYYPAVNIGSYICQTDNKVNNKVAIDGSKVTFSFTVNQPVTIVETQQFLDEDFTYASSDNQTYVGQYTVSNFSDNTEMAFPNVKVKDFLGNEYNSSCDEKILYYKSDVISDAQFTTSNTDASAVIEKDTLTYSFKSIRELTITGNVKIGDEELSVKEKKNGSFDYTYSWSYKVPEDRWDDLASVAVDVSGAKYSDDCGYENMDLPAVTNTVTFYRALKKDQNVTDYSFTTTNTGKTLDDEAVSKNGDTLTVKFKTNRKVDVKSATINEQDVTFTSSDDLNYETSLALSSGTDNTAIPVNIVLSDPKTGTEITFTEDDFDKIIFYGSISFYRDSFKSNHTLNQCCINGNTVTVKFHTNHPVTVESFKFSDVDVTPQSTDNINWTAELLIDDNFDDLEGIGFEAKTVDAAGNNIGYALDGDSEYGIKYYAPLEKGKNVTDFKVATSNTGKTSDGLKVIKSGDDVSVFFKTNRAVNIKDASIGGVIATASSIDNKEWTLTATVETSSDNAAIPIKLTVLDVVGNPGLDLTQDDFEQIVFYDAIDIQLDSFMTDNANSALAKNGDTATVKFHTNHPVNINSAKIGGYDVTPVSDDGIDWTMALAVDDNFNDLEEFGFSVNVGDNASNLSVELTNGDQKIKYYAPLTVSDLTMSSSNDKDAKKYIKNGENIVVTFRLNHDAQVNASINGKTQQAFVDVYKSVLSIGDVGDLTDQQAVHFNVDLTDAAGNTYRTLTEADVDNTIVYYAPITGTVSMTASCSKTEGYVRNGDSLTLSIRTNHETNGTGATIQGREVGISGNKTTYTIPSDEGYLAEGKVAYHINVDDVAGNTYGTGETTSVIYDRTSPYIQITPALSGFTNQKVDVKAAVQDMNIDQNDVVIRLNGEDNTSGGSASETSYEKSLSIDREGTFYVEASAVDKAGNVSRTVSGTIIIDKTNPSVTAIDIDLGDTPAYKTGFVLADHFNIKDTYLKNINCTLTNRTGIGSTKSWNVFAAIQDEGLMTSTISADDMAANVSESVRYSFYTDGTAPKIMVKDKSTGKVVDEKTTFESGVDKTYVVSLDNIWVGNEKPDHFTTLEVRDSRNNIVKNFITETAEINNAEYKITDEGTYTLVCKAKDDVGNETSEVRFKIEADEGSVTVTPTTKDDVVNTGLIVAACAAGVGILAMIIAIIARKKKAKKN